MTISSYKILSSNTISKNKEKTNIDSQDVAEIDPSKPYKTSDRV